MVETNQELRGLARLDLAQKSVVAGEQLAPPQTTVSQDRVKNALSEINGRLTRRQRQVLKTAYTIR